MPCSLKAATMPSKPSRSLVYVLKRLRRSSSPRSGFLLRFLGISIHHFHGAASRVSASETAFAPRQDHLMVEIVAGWEPQSPEEDQRHVQPAHVSLWLHKTERERKP